MFDAAQEKPKIVNSVRCPVGQIQAIERALDHEEGRSDVLRRIIGARGIINRLMAEVLENHIRMQVFDPANAGTSSVAAPPRG